MTNIESNIFVKLLASISLGLSLGSPPTPPLTPLDPYRGGLWGARGGMSEGGDIMCLTPKCDMFLESP